MARKRANITDLLNDLTFRIIYDKYKMLCLNAFEWSGLPKGIEERYVEELLFKFGKAIFFLNPGGSYMCLEAQDGFSQNVYGMPLRYNAIGFGFNKTFHHKKCVIIENNKMRMATDPFIMFYTNKLTEAERTMDVNVKSVKSPVVFAVDDKDVLTFKRLWANVDGNIPAHFVDKGLNLDAIQCFNTNAKFLGGELMDYKKSVENELLTFLGYNNLPTDKKERQLVDEVNVNNQLIESFAELQLTARQDACEKINKMYPDLNVSVKRRDNVCGNVHKIVDNSDGKKV